MPDNLHWVGTWTATPAPAESGAFSNQTLRMNPRVSIGGDRLRVRLSNAYGSGKLLVGACVGLRDTGSGVVAGSNRKLTFGGTDATTRGTKRARSDHRVILPLRRISWGSCRGSPVWSWSSVCARRATT